MMILVLEKGPTQGLEHTLTAEKMYSMNFTVTKKKFCLSLHYHIKDIDIYLIKKNNIVQMKKLGFVKQVFLVGLTILSSFANASSLSCVSMNNQVCKARPEIINVNSNNPVFYPFSIKTVMVVVIILMIRTQKYGFLML